MKLMKNMKNIIMVIIAGVIVAGCDIRFKDNEKPHQIPQHRHENYVKMYEKCLQLKRENTDAKRIICSLDSVIVEKD